VQLTNGHFVAEYRVPTTIQNAMEPRYRHSQSTTEFSHLRYTAATCDPDFFTPANGYALRQRIFNRETELLIAVTSFNEDKMLHARTYHNIMLNVRDICKSKAKFWRSGEEEGSAAWQKITLALVVDGFECMDKSVLDLLAAVGVYQHGIMKKRVSGKDTVAHIFEYTTQLSVDEEPKLVVPLPRDNGSNLVPVQVVLIIKAKNQKKINSHRWIFNALGRQLNVSSHRFFPLQTLNRFPSQRSAS